MQAHLPCTSGRAAAGGASVSERGRASAPPSSARHAAGRRRCVRVCAAATAQEVAVADEKRNIQQMLDRPYKYGFKTIIESDTFPKGLDEDVVRAISAKKKEPEWMLEFRLKAFRKWLTMDNPKWSDNDYPDFDYQASAGERGGGAPGRGTGGSAGQGGWVGGGGNG